MKGLFSLPWAEVKEDVISKGRTGPEQRSERDCAHGAGTQKPPTHHLALSWAPHAVGAIPTPSALPSDAWSHCFVPTCSHQALICR